MRTLVFGTVALITIFRLAGYVTNPRLTDAEIHGIAGEPTRYVERPPHAGPQTIVTWNIERGVRYSKIVDVLRSINPDLVLLQEVDRFCGRSGTRDIARDLADALHMNWVSAGEFQEIGEGRDGVPALTGQALLSTYPIEDPDVIVFTNQTALRWRFNPVQPRRGGRIALRARVADLLIYNLHIESGGSDALRMNQLNEVLADQVRYPDEAVIGGDFNNTSAAIHTVHAALEAGGFVNALGENSRQTSVRHPYPIDWLFVKMDGQVAGKVEQIDGVSDHYPLIGTLKR